MMFFCLKKERVMATKDGIYADYLFKSTVSLNWNEISQVKWAKNGMQLIISSNDKRKIKISTFFQGFGSFCDLVLKFLPGKITQNEVEEALANKIYF
jgi:hypothetical protein